MVRVLALLAFLLAGMLLAAPAPALTITDLTSGQDLLCRPLSGGARATLVFTHSMYGGEVREEFAAAPDGHLRRIAVTTANAAAAEYYAYTAAVVRDGDRFRVAIPAAVFAEIVVRVDRIGDHRLRVGGEDVDLVAVAGDRHAVRLALRPVSTVDQVLSRAC